MSWILSIIALVVALGLRGRVQHLENEVKNLSKNTVVGDREVSEQHTPSVNVAEEKIVASSSSSLDQNLVIENSQNETVPSEDILTRFFRWFAIDWPMKLGAILLFLGIGWVVTVVFWDVIGPVGQVTLGIVIGIAVLFFGAKRIDVSENQGGILLALGAGITYFTLFSARSEYDFFSPASALLFMFLVAVFTATVSVFKKNFSVALLGLFLGGIAPLLTVSPKPDMFGLFAYLFVLCIGTLWVVRLTGWRNLTVASLILYAVYAVPTLLMSHPGDADQGTKMMIAILFALLFFASSILALLHDRKAETGDLAVSLCNGLILLGWIQMIILPEWQSFMSVLVALVASVGAFIVYSFSDLKAPVYVHSAVAGVFIAMATAYELNGSLLVLAYIFETVAIVFGARFGIGSVQASQKAMLVSLVPMILSVQSFWSYAGSREFLTKDFFALLFLSMMFFLFSLLLSGEEETAENVSRKTLTSILGALYAFVLLWLSNHILFSDDTAILLSLLVYTLVGMFFYIRGKIDLSNNDKLFGVSLLVFVTGHLLLVDVWQMDVLGRIVTFCVIGILLMSTSFIGNKRNE